MLTPTSQHVSHPQRRMGRSSRSFQSPRKPRCAICGRLCAVVPCDSQFYIESHLCWRAPTSIQHRGAASFSKPEVSQSRCQSGTQQLVSKTDATCSQEPAVAWIAGKVLIPAILQHLLLKPRTSSWICPPFMAALLKKIRQDDGAPDARWKQLDRRKKGWLGWGGRWAVGKPIPSPPGRVRHFRHSDHV